MRPGETVVLYALLLWLAIEHNPLLGVVVFLAAIVVEAIVRLGGARIFPNTRRFLATRRARTRRPVRLDVRRPR